MLVFFSAHMKQLLWSCKGTSTMMKIILLLPCFLTLTFGHKVNATLKQMRDEIADPETTTPNNCKCTSLCGTSAFDLFKLDWCYVADECGQYSFSSGWWDYCQYLERGQPDYGQLTWQEKQAMIWDKVKADSTLGGDFSMDIITESVVTPFENEWDRLPNGRHKGIHGQGVICPFDVEISSESPFSGLLKADSKISGLIRMGPAADIGGGLVPGAGIKFLRTGVMSANFLILNQLDPMPDGNFNYFGVPLMNQIGGGEPAGVAQQVLVKKFCQTGHCITKVGLSNLCTHDQDGNEADQVEFPYKVIFEPADVSISSDEPNGLEALLTSMISAIPVGSNLYNIRALRSPDDDEGFILGTAVTTDQCVTSLYGDMKLAFKHQWIEEDAALKPEWAEAYANDCVCNPP